MAREAAEAFHEILVAFTPASLLLASINIVGSEIRATTTSTSVGRFRSSTQNIYTYPSVIL